MFNFKLPTIVISLLSMLLLSGCFMSQIPLISETEADFPFKTFTYEIEGEDDKVTLVKTGNAYTAPDERGDGKLLLKLVAENTYLLQAEVEDDDENFYLYALAKVADDKSSAQLMKPFASKADREVASKGKYGMQICMGDSQSVCLGSLQGFVDFALSDSSHELKKVIIHTTQ